MYRRGLKRILELQERSSSPSFSYTKILLGERINFLEFQFGYGVCKLFLSLHSGMHTSISTHIWICWGETIYRVSWDLPIGHNWARNSFFSDIPEFPLVPIGHEQTWLWKADSLVIGWLVHKSESLVAFNALWIYFPLEINDRCWSDDLRMYSRWIAWVFFRRLIHNSWNRLLSVWQTLKTNLHLHLTSDARTSNLTTDKLTQKISGA